MKWLSYILLLLVFWGCEKQIPYNATDFEKKLVVNANLERGELIKIQLSESVNPVQVPNLSGLTGELTYLLREDSVVVDYQTTNLKNGNLSINKSPKSGKVYELEVVMSGFPPIKMTDTVPSVQPVFSIDTLYSQGEEMRLKLNLDDPSTQEIYMLSIRVHGRQISGMDTFETNYRVNFLSNDKVFLKNINNASTSGSFGLFDDQLFNGSKKGIEIQFKKSEIQLSDFKPAFVQVKVANISKAMFNYYVGLLENNHIYGGPLATYSLSNGNVQDGLGLFAFLNSSTAIYPIQ